MNYRYVINIIGKILLIEALLMLAPILIGIIYRESSVYAFAVSAAVLVFAGTACFFTKPKSTVVRAREGLVITGLAWIFVSLFGALPLCLSGEIPSYLDCLFEIASGFTTTGASILTDIESLSRASLFWRSFTHWIGGMGVLVFALAVLPSADTQSIYLMRAEVPGPQVGKLVAKLRLTARLLYVIYMALTLVEVVFLLFGGLPVFDSFVTSFATAGTGGFSIKNASIAAYGSVYSEIVITVFMLLFSLNFNLFYIVLIGGSRSALKSEELRWFAIIVAAAIAVVTFNILPLYESFGEALRYSSFHVASMISTTGFVAANYDVWPNFSKAVLVVLMFLGACSGSTGGGIKISRIIVIVKTAVGQIKRQLSPRCTVPVRFDGKILDSGVKKGITAYMFAYLMIFTLSVLILCFEKVSMTTSFTAVAACLNNVGPGLEGVGALGNYSGFSALSKIVLIFNMIAGRLELFPLLAIFVPYAWKRR